MIRRHFIRQVSAGSFLLGAGQFSLDLLDMQLDRTKLTILHTNDVHSRVDPFPMDGSRNQGMGGVSRRASLIKKIRAAEENVLLFDAGDIFQGTPYFNFFGGEIEMKLMTEMGYDAATIGNHDFDGGIDGLEKQMKHANFPMLIANYEFKDTVLAGKTKPYKIFMVDEIKVGVFGIGIELDGLVPKSLSGETQYLDPVSTANKTAGKLKNDLGCDYVICLSHLGYRYRNDKVSDTVLASKSSDINMIIGGHTHSFLKKPDVLKNAKGDPVLVNQVGWAGIMLGRIDVYFEKNRKGKCQSCKNIWITDGN